MSGRPQKNGLDTPVRYVRGVGEARAGLLRKMGIQTVADLLMHVPRRYEDRRRVLPVAAVRAGGMVVVQGIVRSCGVGHRAKGGTVFEALLQDETGMIVCRWYNAAYLKDVIHSGDRLVVHGKAQRVRNGVVIQHPEFEHLSDASEDASLNMGRIVPVYSVTEGLSQRIMRRIMWNAVSAYSDQVREALPDTLRMRRSLPHIQSALRTVHFPDDLGEAEQARRRLAFEELLYMQLVLVRRKLQTETDLRGWAHLCPGRLKEKFLKSLPFQLTRAQERVISEIERDLKSPRPMHRLLQGDVGSGKTVVAVCAILQVIESGAQAALMAPTEILAEQHARVLKSFLEPLGIRAPLLTGSVEGGQREQILRALERGRTQLVVGTHALIQEPVRFRRLGLVVIDEQHRFGVAQRGRLYRKGVCPDVLVMTATPIPRTLAMTVYGDLDLSVIDEMPPGRRPVKTSVIREKDLGRTYAFIRDQVGEGRQAFVVCPLVSESEKVEAEAAEKVYEELWCGELAGIRLGLLHGQMDAEDKERVMANFRRGRLDVLVATPVVEVGVDVPNAAVMLILSAERFGLAQLHQLRGRVARSHHQPHCFLHMGRASAEAERRLALLAQTNDGFRIAEEDLKLRGMGNLLGKEQWGRFRFRVADLLQDGAILAAARREAEALIREDPALNLPEHRLLAARVKEFERRGGGLAGVG